MRKLLLFCTFLLATLRGTTQTTVSGHVFNGIYTGKHLDQLAFPIGGIGAGMICLEGTGALSHVSIRNAPDIFNEPALFAAIGIKGQPDKARVLEGPVPDWKKFSVRNGGQGDIGRTWGLARFHEAQFLGRFPFGSVRLTDRDLTLRTEINGWSPFIPTDADNSSLPVGALEYRFQNTGSRRTEYVFSFNAGGFAPVRAMPKGFILSREYTAQSPEEQCDLAFFTNEPSAVIDHCWFRGGWFDPLTMAWKHIQECRTEPVPPQANSGGASLFVPFTLDPGETRTIRVMIAWYSPNTKLQFGNKFTDPADSTIRDASADLPSPYYKPWYSSKFTNIDQVAAYWSEHYDELQKKTILFSNSFYRSTLPPEVMEAIGSNLSILKSPTVMRQFDGRFWGREGSKDAVGSCAGSCTHVWNYAQALPHLFPGLERSMREAEFFESQNAAGHQQFRSALPIRPQAHDFYAASDGQLGGIMKAYRDWRISGDSAWLRRLYPRIRISLDYCIRTWDPRHTGSLEEPHHNTYDIEFWGADGMTTSCYLGALEAMIRMSEYLGENAETYKTLFAKGKTRMERDLYNGRYFIQKIQWTGLNATDPVAVAQKSVDGNYSLEALQLLQKEGPKYQYGNGCLSDGIIGDWLARVCGLPEPLDSLKIQSHLLSVYKFNLKKDLSAFSNPQRPGYALGNEGGLLLCTWPEGGQLSLPFVYSNEVWTGIEYQAASHLIFEGKVKEGLDIVRTCRNRYDGRIRNPFDEYEWGHFYARALASYALLEALTGVRYDAVDKTLYVDSRIGDFTSFLSTDTGFGNVVYHDGKARLEVVYGSIQISRIKYGR